ncbi:MAG: hypothetical protein Q9163_004235 [Psora crenata]
MNSHPEPRPTEGTISQYHHFIPRFILRNFAHPYRPPKVSKELKKRGKRKGKKGYYPGNPMLYTINLSGVRGELVEAPVSHAFGLTDMYRDLADATNQHRLEQQLSRLESRAAEIITKIRKVYEAGKSEVWLPRTERDTLRKFLFVMKYRSSGFHKRFYNHTSESYSEDDKVRLIEYMREKGYQKPVDIWFDNINTIIEMKMDLEGKWMGELLERMYPDDAQWAIAHMQMMYLALCTPSSQDDEFILTENAYSIHEGPVSCLISPDTGESTVRCYTEYHVFAAISPKLIMVLRNNSLPIPEEDSNDEIRRWRETMQELHAEQHNNPLEACSTLADLPITKARNSYTRIVDGRVTLAAGEDGSYRLYHKFCFRFFPISTEHVNKINFIMLEEAYKSSTIAFNSQLAARKTLEHYLSMPIDHKNPHAFKVVGERPDDQRLAYLKKLEHVLRELGSDTAAVYHVQKSMFGILGAMLQRSLPSEQSETMRLYTKLGQPTS